jgi:hypothetical protein
MGDMRMPTKFRSENLNGKDHWEDLGVDERPILKLMFEK